MEEKKNNWKKGKIFLDVRIFFNEMQEIGLIWLIIRKFQKKNFKKIKKCKNAECFWKKP